MTFLYVWVGPKYNPAGRPTHACEKLHMKRNILRRFINFCCSQNQDTRLLSDNKTSLAKGATFDIRTVADSVREAFSYRIRHISLWFNEVWPYASLNHMKYAISRMKMPHVRKTVISLLRSNLPRTDFSYWFSQSFQETVWLCERVLMIP